MAAISYLDTLAGNAFGPAGATLKDNAILLAVAYTGVADGTSNQQDVGLAMLALRALRAREQSEDRTFPPDLGALLTPEIERLLGDPTDVTTKFGSIVQYKQPSTDVGPFTGGDS